MDAGFEADSASSTDSSIYGFAFLFSVCLTYSDTNRSKVGYDIDIIVHSDNSILWTNSLLLFLHDQGLKPVLIA